METSLLENQVSLQNLLSRLQELSHSLLKGERRTGLLGHWALLEAVILKESLKTSPVRFTATLSESLLLRVEFLSSGSQRRNSSVHGDSSGKSTGVGCDARLQGIFPTQGAHPGFLHCRQILYHLIHQAPVRSPVLLDCFSTHLTLPFSLWHGFWEAQSQICFI